MKIVPNASSLDEKFATDTSMQKRAFSYPMNAEAETVSFMCDFCG